MSTTNIYRLSGIVLAVGGLTGVAAFVIDLVVDALYPHIEDDTLLAVYGRTVFLQHLNNKSSFP